jgi:hypothetical protein
MQQNGVHEHLDGKLFDPFPPPGYCLAFLLDETGGFFLDDADRSCPDIASRLGWSERTQTVLYSLPGRHTAAAGDALGHRLHLLRERPGSEKQVDAKHEIIPWWTASQAEPNPIHRTSAALDSRTDHCTRARQDAEGISAAGSR